MAVLKCIKYFLHKYLQENYWHKCKLYSCLKKIPHCPIAIWYKNLTISELSSNVHLLALKFNIFFIFFFKPGWKIENTNPCSDIYVLICFIFILLLLFFLLRVWRYQKGQLESVYQRTENTMTKRKSTNNQLQNIHIKLKIE